MTKTFLCLLTVAVCTSLFCPGAYAEATYTYVGNPFTAVTCSNNNTNCVSSVTGSFTLTNPLAPNLSYYSFTPNQFSFGDGTFSLTSSQNLPVEEFWASTDNTGAITYWTFTLGANIPDPVACDSYNEMIGSYSTTDTTNPSGDWGCYFYPNGTWSGGGNHGSPGVWTETTSSSVPEPSSLLMIGSGVFGLGGIIRRKLGL